jgi:hypothetical protein
LDAGTQKLARLFRPEAHSCLFFSLLDF